MKIKDYMLVKAFDRYDLENKVRELLNQGYTPFGAAFAGYDDNHITLWLFQTMILTEDE